MKVEVTNKVTITTSELEALVRGHLGLSNSERVVVTVVMDQPTTESPPEPPRLSGCMFRVVGSSGNARQSCPLTT